MRMRHSIPPRDSGRLFGSGGWRRTATLEARLLSVRRPAYSVFMQGVPAALNQCVDIAFDGHRHHDCGPDLAVLAEGVVEPSSLTVPKSAFRNRGFERLERLLFFAGCLL